MSETGRLCLVFGTSADPFHNGHRQLIIEATKALEKRGYQVDELVILPVYRRHNISEVAKNDLDRSFDDRLALCKIGASEVSVTLEKPEGWMTISRLEKDLSLATGTVNYTAESMRALRQFINPTFQLAFLVGSDSLNGEEPNLSHWHHLSDLLCTTTLVVCPREGFEPNIRYLDQLVQQGARIIELTEVKVKEISSSDIRAKLISGSDIAEVVRAGWLHQQALNYILTHHLIAHWRGSASRG